MWVYFYLAKTLCNMNKITETEASPAKKHLEVLAPPRLMRTTDSVYPQLQFLHSFSEAVKKHHQEFQNSSNELPCPCEKGQGVIINSITFLNCKTLWYKFFPDNYSTERFQASKDQDSRPDEQTQYRVAGSSIF